MRICYATNYLPGYHKIWGGAEQACYKMAKLLVQNGQEITVLATRPLKALKEKFEFFSLPVLENYFLGRRLVFLKERLGYDPLSGIPSYRILKKIRPDVLHLHNFDLLSFSLVISAKKLGIPILSSIYDYWLFCPRRILVNHRDEICRTYHSSHCATCIALKRFNFRQKVPLIFRRKLFDFFLNKIDIFLTLSQASVEVLQDYGIKKERITVIPLPLLERADIQNIAVEENSILFVGWVQPHKGLHIILEAMSQILEELPEVRLYVIETGEEESYKNRILSLIKELKLNKHVLLLGKLSHKKVKEYLKKSSVVVIPEQWENVGPLLLSEAMGLAKPIVASSIGSIPEFIRDGENGLLANPKDPLDFAKKITWMLRNRKMALEMGKKAREDVKQICDEKKILKATLNLYKSLVRK